MTKPASARKSTSEKPQAKKLLKVKQLPKRSCPLAPGRAYAFKFPRHNFYGVYSKMEPRRILVQRVRDLKKEPIDYLTVEIQPLLRRSRFLVIGLDLDINEERSFYTESMSDIVELDPGATERRPMTIWIVENKPFVRLECAEATAAAEAMLTRKPVPIDKVVIPIDLVSKLVRLVLPDELKRQGSATARGKHPGQ